MPTLELLVENEWVKKALYLACAYIEDYSGSCPSDMFDYEPVNCEKNVGKLPRPTVG